MAVAEVLCEPRADPEKVEALMESIRDIGLQEPIGDYLWGVDLFIPPCLPRVIPSDRLILALCFPKTDLRLCTLERGMIKSSIH